MKSQVVVTVAILCTVLVASAILGWAVSTAVLGVTQFADASAQPFGEIIIQTQSHVVDKAIGIDMSLLGRQADGLVVVGPQNIRQWFLPDYDRLAEWVASRPWCLELEPRTIRIFDQSIFWIELPQVASSVAYEMIGVDLSSYLGFNKALGKYGQRIDIPQDGEGIVISSNLKKTIEDLTGKELSVGDPLKISYSGEIGGDREIEVPYLGEIPYANMIWDFPRRREFAAYMDCLNFLTLLGYNSGQRVKGDSGLSGLDKVDLDTLRISRSGYVDASVQWHQLCVRVRPGTDVDAAIQEIQGFLPTIDKGRLVGDGNYTVALRPETVLESSYAYHVELESGQERMAHLCVVVGIVALLILGELQYLLYFRETEVYGVCRLLGCRKWWLGRYIAIQVFFHLFPAGTLGYCVGWGMGTFGTWLKTGMPFFSLWIPLVGLGALLALSGAMILLSLFLVVRVSPIQALTKGALLR